MVKVNGEGLLLTSPQFTVVVQQDVPGSAFCAEDVDEDLLVCAGVAGCRGPGDDLPPVWY